MEISSEAKISEFLDLKCLSWNIEGFRRNHQNLRFFCDELKPDLIFLSEPQLFQCDIALLTKPFTGEFSVILNSEETNNPDLALDTTKANGGTLVMWRSKLDPYIVVLPTTSSSFLPILLKIPGFSPSIHIGVYFPTSGKDAEFVTALSLLDTFMEETAAIHSCPVYIRGDANCNPKNTVRSTLLKHFCSKHRFASLDFLHPSHHHFTGQGSYDAQLDVLLYQPHAVPPEELSKLVCKLENPLVESAHDLILSTCHLPSVPTKSTDTSENKSAPKIVNNRVKIIWDNENLPHYQELISDNLARLRETWSNSSSPASVSILLQSTCDVFSSCAAASNKTVKLGKMPKTKPSKDLDVSAAQKRLLRLTKLVKQLETSSSSTESQLHEAKFAATSARAELRRLVNSKTMLAENARDALTHKVLDSDPSLLFKAVKSIKSNDSTNIQTLKVGDKVYSGKTVPDGFFDSLSSLKSPDMASIHSSSSFKSAFSDYSSIRKICSTGLKIPQISTKDATEILYSMKPDVNDLFSMTPRHYINAGIEGVRHFHFLMNLIIEDVNLFSLPELNSVWAMVLYKGHGKPKDSDRSYRTISTCPLLAKSLDIYIGSLYESGWAAVQAETQFQGSGSSHELAALLLTESIQYSLYSAKKPLFVLMLDAKSAFDKILKEFIIRNAFLAGSHGQGLLYLADRLSNRKTFVEWDKCLMGPILDLLGVEQGGCVSDKLYKLANNEQLSVAQLSQLGLAMNSIVVSAIGQADDTLLISDCIFKLQLLLQLAVDYCTKYHVELVPEKTKLLCYTPSGLASTTLYWKLVSPVSLQNQKLEFSNEAEHVGIIRSVDGNLPNIVSRMSAHNAALKAVLPAGIARAHRGNPAAALRIELLYASPVLLSGLASLVLSKTETDILKQYYKVNLQRLQKLYNATPDPVVYFLGGSLPLPALLHIRQLGHLGMIARLGPDHILHKHGCSTLTTAKSSSRSWFLQVREISSKYELPDPLTILTTSPSTKLSYKKLVRSRVMNYWETKLRQDAAPLLSLEFFQPQFYSLSRPHPIWSSAGSNPYEVEKACCQAKMLSGRYRTCWLSRHWSGDSSGYCTLPSCRLNPIFGTLPHILRDCEDLQPARLRVFSLWSDFLQDKPLLLPIVQKYKEDASKFVQFVVDCTVLPEVISLKQLQGKWVHDSLLYLTRTFCFSVHKARLKLLGKWNVK